MIQYTLLYMEKIEALAEYLDVNVDDLEEIRDNTFIVNDEDSEFYDQEFVVYTDYEADEAVKKDLERFVDEAGWAIDLPIEDYIHNDEWFDEAQSESNAFYARGIMSESDDVYESRFVAECVDRGVIPDDDDWFEEDEDGKLTIVKLMDGTSDVIYDAEDFFDAFVESLNSDYEDGYEWYIDNFGESGLRHIIREGHLSIDFDKLAEDIIWYDGRGHGLSSYDGTEHELEGDYYAYRMN